MIGLVDFNLLSSTSQTKLIPNLEIMKLASYYKTEENQFCRLLSLNEQELTSYDKIYFFSEGHSPPQIPKQFLRANNVIYGGTAFTNGEYKPFENSIIDYTLPRVFIYKEFLKQKYDEGLKYNVISHLLDATYYRNYAGDNRLPLPAIIPNKQVLLYDKDFFYPDWQQTIKIISERKPSTIIRIHPIICNTVSQYFSARDFPKISRANEYILDFNIPLNEVKYLLKKYKNLFLADITATSNVFLPVGGSFIINNHYVNDLIYKINLLYCFWSAGIFLKLKFIEPKIGFNNPFYNITKKFCVWTTNINIPKQRNFCFNDKIPKKIKDNILLEEKELLQTYYKNINTLFMQSFNNLKKEGAWQP